jgi:hypothetical protein
MQCLAVEAGLLLLNSSKLALRAVRWRLELEAQRAHQP